MTVALEQITEGMLKGVLFSRLEVYSTRLPLIRRDNENVYVSYPGKVIDGKGAFDKWAKQYRKPVPIEQMLEELNGKGHLFANIGVSGYALVNADNAWHVIGVAQERRGIEGYPKEQRMPVVKLYSGYIQNVPLLKHPEMSIQNETGEEILPFTKEGKIMPIAIDGVPVERHYDIPEISMLGVEYDDSAVLNLRTGTELPSGLDGREVLIEGKSIPGSPKMYYASNSNSAQLVFPFAIASLDGIEHLLHAEEKPRLKPDGTLDLVCGHKYLETQLNKFPLYLLRLGSNGRLNGEVFRHVNGELQPVDASNIVLSEAFAPKEHEGVVRISNIPLSAYLSK